MGGVYMLPLGISVDNRRSAGGTRPIELTAPGGGIRPIGLTPPGVSMNQVLEHIVDDIIEGSTRGTTVPSIFDAYRSCVVSPDHLFLGLAQDIINAVLLSVPKEVRDTAEAVAKDLVRDDALVWQNRLIDSGRRAVLSMTIFAMYSFILVAPAAFQISWEIFCGDRTPEMEESDRFLEVIELLNTLQGLISKTHFTPLIEVDAQEDITWYNDDEGSCRLRELHLKGKEYIRKVIAEDTIPSNLLLDKPNLHRLLEFYTHSLPLLGDIRYFQELLFERAHQPLKRAIAKSNHRDAQLQAMEHRLSEDWKMRLCLESSEGGDSPEDWNAEDLRTMCRLLDREPSTFPDVSTLRDCVFRSFPPPVMKELCELRRRRSCYSSVSLRWELDPAQRMSSVLSEEATNLIEGLQGDMCSMYELKQAADVGSNLSFATFFYFSVKWVSRGGMTNTGKPSVRSRLNRFYVVQVGAEPRSDGLTKLNTFLVAFGWCMR